jgi:hypothetical protein
MVKSSRQKRKVTNKRKKRQFKKKVLRGGMEGRPMAEHMCPFTPEIINDKGYIEFIDLDVFEQIKADLLYVEIRGERDQGGHMGDVPDKKHLIVYDFMPKHGEDPRPHVKATELLFVRKGIAEMDGWHRTYIARGSPPKRLEKQTHDGYPQKMERLNSNEPLPLPGAIAKWTGGGGGTAYIVCKSKIQPDLDICRQIAECLKLPYSPSGSETYVTRYSQFSNDKLLNVERGENIYA